MPLPTLTSLAMNRIFHAWLLAVLLLWTGSALAVTPIRSAHASQASRLLLQNVGAVDCSMT
ncbi:hypothetical protein [Xanthomonas fragariae]|uniref:hypothetical protein n=1 Tax=Xanthomonas fragariae TaxID=48664 RepID=UPI0012EADBD1|nr:hypothetical protein [Xanthomonas fragariae]